VGVGVDIFLEGHCEIVDGVQAEREVGEEVEWKESSCYSPSLGNR